MLPFHFPTTVNPTNSSLPIHLCAQFHNWSLLEMAPGTSSLRFVRVAVSVAHTKETRAMLLRVAGFRESMCLRRSEPDSDDKCLDYDDFPVLPQPTAFRVYSPVFVRYIGLLRGRRGQNADSECCAPNLLSIYMLEPNQTPSMKEQQ